MIKIVLEIKLVKAFMPILFISMFTEKQSQLATLLSFFNLQEGRSDRKFYDDSDIKTYLHV